MKSSGSVIFYLEQPQVLTIMKTGHWSVGAIKEYIYESLKIKNNVQVFNKI